MTRLDWKNSLCGAARLTVGPSLNSVMGMMENCKKPKGYRYMLLLQNQTQTQHCFIMCLTYTHCLIHTRCCVHSVLCLTLSFLSLSTRLMVCVCLLAATDSLISKPTPLYGQPSWWGEDEDAANKTKNRGGKLPEQGFSGQRMSFISLLTCTNY